MVPRRSGSGGASKHKPTCADKLDPSTPLTEVGRSVKPRPDWPVLWDAHGRGYGRVVCPDAPITQKSLNSALERARASIGLTPTNHVARHSFCTNWVHEQGRDDFSIERLARQVGTSPGVLRSTYVHFDLKPSDLAAIKSFGRRSALTMG